jgi:hypothetical protein
MQAVGGELEVRVIDPDSDVSYYRGRWRELRSTDTGRFVARRPQAWGADLWCFINVSRGTVEKLLDLPVQSALATGADEAWRLQAALDALRNEPQRLRVAGDGEGSYAILDLFAPVPSWIQRRLDIVGRPEHRRRGALFSYALPAADLEEEVNFIRQNMWISIDYLETA